MKVLLINPSTFRKGYGEYAEAGGKSQPLGLCYLVAVLERNNIDVGILDAEVLDLSLEHTLDKIKEFNPDIVGITVFTTTLNSVENLARQIKKNYSSIFIAVGGPHITAAPEETLKNKDFDLGVIGEGENTFLEFIKNFPGTEHLRDIDGIVYRKDGEIVRTKPRKLIENLDDLPFPSHHLLPSIKLYHPQIHSMKKQPIAPIMSSRGCPFQCIYCDKSVFGTRYRVRSSKNVVDEIEYLIKNYGVKEIIFLDDNFTLIRDRILNLCNEIIRRKINIFWSCSTRADEVDEELLKLMKKSGCWMIAIGIESGNSKILQIANKKVSLEKIREAVELINKCGIRIRGFFMLGLPGETKETLEDTINFAKSLKLGTAEFTICTPFPNTPLYKNISKYGTLDTSDLSKFSVMFAVFTPYGLSQDYLAKKQIEAHRKFYLRPSKIMDFVLQIRSWNDIKRYLTGFKILTKNIFKK